MQNCPLLRILHSHTTTHAQSGLLSHSHTHIHGTTLSLLLQGASASDTDGEQKKSVSFKVLVDQKEIPANEKEDENEKM